MKRQRDDCHDDNTAKRKRNENNLMQPDVTNGMCVFITINLLYTHQYAYHFQQGGNAVDSVKDVKPASVKNVNIAWI